MDSAGLKMLAQLHAAIANDRFIKWRPQIVRYKRADDSKPIERHYSTIEISQAWGISADLVRNIFKTEPGVLKFDRPATRTKRAYSTLRVPESVLKRVHTRLSSGG